MLSGQSWQSLQDLKIAIENISKTAILLGGRICIKLKNEVPGLCSTNACRVGVQDCIDDDSLFQSSNRDLRTSFSRVVDELVHEALTGSRGLHNGPTLLISLTDGCSIAIPDDLSLIEVANNAVNKLTEGSDLSRMLSFQFVQLGFDISPDQAFSTMHDQCKTMRYIDCVPSKQQCSTSNQ